MTYAEIVNAITTRFNVEVKANVSGGITVQYDNDGAFDKPEGSRWARASVLLGASFQVSLGENKRFRTPGLLVVSIFIPNGSGTAAAYEVAALVRTAFRGITAGGVVYTTPYISVIGITEGGEWQLNVTCPFDSDDIET
jgi:hypothetical protein